QSASLVICLPNQKTLKLLPAGASPADAFKTPAGILQQHIQCAWQALQSENVLGVAFSDLCQLLSQRSSHILFALTECSGSSRAAIATEGALSHPILDCGVALDQAQAVAVVILGGPELTMAEVSGIMEQIQARCPNLPVMMSACISSQC